MPLCEMCGKESPLFKAEIEGTILSVCQACAQHGEILQKPKKPQPKKKKPLPPKEESTEPIEVVVSDYSQKIKQAREKKGLKQEEFAKKINEKTSLIHKIETGHFEPNLKLAKKIGHFLNISLIEKEEEEKIEPQKNKSSAPLTIGDLISSK